MTEKKQILKSASIITLVTIASRIFGYLRDQRITLLLGTTLAADSFVLAYRIPNLLRRLVGEGSMTASFIPVFTGYLKDKPKEEVWDFANRLFWTLAVVVAALTILGMLYSPTVVKMFTFFEHDPTHWDQAVALNRIIFPYIFFIALAALAMAILNCFQIFGLPASTPILLNISIIVFSIGIVWKQFDDPAIALSVGVLVGGALQFLVQVPALVKQGMRFKFGLSFKHPGIRAVGRLMVPGFFGIGVYQVNLFVDSIFATAPKMPEGSVIALYVADRVMELVLGGYAIAVATAILPMMSMQAASHDFDNLKKTFAFALRIVSYITIPAMVGLIVLREPIIRVLFEHGRFGAESTTLTARALLYYAMGLPAFAAIKLIVPAFYSTQDTRTPVRVAVYALGLNVLLNTVFMKSFFQTFYNGGPALATSLAAYFNFFMLFVIFRQRFGRLGTFQILASISKIAVCSGVMGVLCYAMLKLSRFETYTHFLPQLVVLVLILVAATAAFIALSWVMRCTEVEEVYGIATRKDERVAPPRDPNVTGS
ncbi:MAG: murein biosynthesis integral membrane protein MurJ [Acidobacteria bacterium]|nr:murein biosynthesis integral membrane protein MurJ [Acidobacteriota bacterium]